MQGVANANRRPQPPHRQFHQRIPPSNPRLAAPAAAAERQPAHQRHILPPCQRSPAASAVRPRMHDALAIWPAAHAHVQETAERQPQKAGKNGSQNADHSEVEYTAVGRPSSFHAKLELHGSSASKLQCKPSRAANRNRSGACGRAFSGISCHHGPAACSRRLPLGS